MADARYQTMWAFVRECNYKQLGDIGADMKCTICTSMLINAHSAPCGCRYCLGCVQAYLGGESRLCPGNMDDCRLEELEIGRNILPDHAINHRISRLVVECRHLCGFRCELRSMEEHARACGSQPASCPFVSVGCTETQLGSDRISEHLVRASGPHAALLVTRIGLLQGENCAMRKEAGELRLEVANLTNENKLVRAENSSLRAEMERHREEHLAVQAGTEQQLLELRARMETQARDIELLGEKCSRSEEKMGELERQVRKKQEQLPMDTYDVWEELDSEDGEAERHVEEMEVIVEQKNRREIVWRISGWAAKSQSARGGSCKVIFSNSFFSHENGYRMCLSVWPDGRGAGKGTHLALFFHLVLGPFNNALSWPFKRAVTLSLVDQRTGRDHASRTFTFEECPTNVNWCMPVTERNRGLGTYRMVELAALSSSSWLCQDDRITIKCCITK